MSLALALFAASTAPLAPPPRIALEDRSIRAGDLAHVPGRESVVLGAMPEGKTTVELDAAAAERLLRNRLPLAKFTLRFADRIVLEAPAAARPTGRCFEARSDIPEGAIIRREDVAEIACNGDEVASGLGYDRERGAPVASGGIRAGSYLGGLRPLDSDRVARGTRLTFRTGAGPVLVERRVEALQAGRAGSRIFARTDDGEVIAAPVLAEALPQPETAE